ncbi:MAG: divergent polysaccharide deacetylase family protein [candidate division KSB1 bacterium]|nr:divergent polysaccharide deacetylase family protein [candidate division KSB1 bacterium]MDZ7340083.1 divergent polysaccharide deacetylase family protein [candidate division KSB1 bacterium]
MARRKSYRPRPIKRKSARETLRRQRPRGDKKYFATLSKALRLIILLGICGFIIYRLFIMQPPSKRKPVAPKKAQPKVELLPIDTTRVDSAEKKVKLSSLPKSEALDRVLAQVFDEFNISSSWIVRSGNLIRVQLPADLPAVTVIWEIIQRVEELDLKIIKSEEDLKTNRSTIAIGKGREVMATLVFSANPSLKRRVGKIAIIIDDFGYANNKTARQFLEMKYPVTLSIIPGQKYSTEIAAAAREVGKKYLVHLPMEAVEEKVEDSDYTIYTDLSDEEIEARVRGALDLLPDAVGVNNHMGSQATADIRVMKAVLSTLKSRNKLFIDSRTTAESVAPQIAHQQQLRFLSNDGFLERNRSEKEDYIQQKLAAVARLASKRGRAIVIGHPYKQTARALLKELPRLEKQGFEIVPLTEIVQ